MSYLYQVFFWNDFPRLGRPLWAPPPLVCLWEYPPAVGGPGWKNGLGALMVDLIAFTWSTSSLNFWANSDGATSPKFESSSTSGIHLCDDLGSTQVVYSATCIAQQLSCISGCCLHGVWSVVLSFQDSTQEGKGVKDVCLYGGQLLINSFGDSWDLIPNVAVQCRSPRCVYLSGVTRFLLMPN